MHIAVVSHIRHPIRPPFFSVQESHAWYLVRALRAAGHDVTHFASGDSDHDPVPIVGIHYDQEFPWHDRHGTRALADHLDTAFATTARDLRDGDFDVIHNTSLHHYLPRLARAERLPMLTSLYRPPAEPLRQAILDGAAPWSQVTVPTQTQAQIWWPKGPAPQNHVVPTGIDPADWPFRGGGNGSAIWAGQIAPEMGTHFAVTAAQFAGLPLTIFGRIERQDYFDRMVRPYLGKAIRYGGPVQGAELASQMGQASVFLFTPLGDAPSGRAAIEAMATGLPVAAVDNGPVREIIGDAAGCFAPPNEPAALGMAMKRAMQIDPAIPRRRVEDHFTVERMVADYVTLYAQARDGLSHDMPAADFGTADLRIASQERLAAE
ncbi:MAG: glycosyltransferase [Pseudomonadota bacterium]